MTRHKVSFQKLQREILEILGIKIAKSTYHHHKAGTKTSIRTMWLMYFFTFWKVRYDYNFSIYDFISPDFNPVDWEPGPGALPAFGKKKA